MAEPITLVIATGVAISASIAVYHEYRDVKERVVQWYKEKFWNFITSSKTENERLFYNICRTINQASSKLPHKAKITYVHEETGEEFEFSIPAIGRTVTITETIDGATGDITFKSLSADGIHVDGFELSMYKNSPIEQALRDDVGKKLDKCAKHRKKTQNVAESKPVAPKDTRNVGRRILDAISWVFRCLFVW